jgi:hypothetical protein
MLGELAISISWLVVDSDAGWRERTSSHAFVIGAVLLLVGAVPLQLTRGRRALVRASATAGVAASFLLLCLPHLPQSLGGLAPACTVVYVLNGNPMVAEDLSAGSGVSPPVELLFSDESFHHLRLSNGDHVMVNRSIVMLATCP